MSRGLFFGHRLDVVEWLLHSALLSLLLFALGSMAVLAMLFSGLIAFGAAKTEPASATIPVGASLLAFACFYGGARLRRRS